MTKKYRVGYGHPPIETRFKKGVSGNPRGRPKVSPSFKTDFLRELQAKITIREQGVLRRLTKRQALIKAVWAKALQGDRQAAAMIFNLILRMEPDAEIAAVEYGANDPREVLSQKIEAIIQRLDGPRPEKGPSETKT